MGTHCTQERIDLLHSRIQGVSDVLQKQPGGLQDWSQVSNREEQLAWAGDMGWTHPPCLHCEDSGFYSEFCVEE